jgi:hypothetical protein
MFNMDAKRAAVRSTSFHEDVERALTDSGLVTARLHPADVARHTARGLIIARCLASALFDLPAQYTTEFARTALPEYSFAAVTVEPPTTPPVLLPAPPALLQLIEQRETEASGGHDGGEASTGSETESSEPDTDLDSFDPPLPTGTRETLVPVDDHMRQLFLCSNGSPSEAVVDPAAAPLAQYITPGITKVRSPVVFLACLRFSTVLMQVVLRPRFVDCTDGLLYQRRLYGLVFGTARCVAVARAT